MRYIEPVSGLLPGDGANARHEHHWVVFSTAIREVALLVGCAECGAFGTVDDPTPEEWAEAFDASLNPYRWHDGTRVTVRNRVSEDQP
jgi:hypothetical protein